MTWLPKKPIVVVLVALLTACGGATQPVAAAERLPMWRLETDSNTIWLLGSVHLLRSSDYPLAAPIEAAYSDAEVLLMELDMDDLDPFAIQTELAAKSRLPDDQELRDIIGAELYSRAKRAAAEVDIPLGTLDNTEPWYAALTITNLLLMRLGYVAEQGVEMHFVRRAKRDAKPILGLETIAAQLDIFDELPLARQREMFAKTIDDLPTAERTMATLLEAWKRGDVETLERELLEDFATLPKLYESLLVRRNRSWVKQIEAHMREPDDYLVVVGALHLVGDDSVVAMLRLRGHEVVQQ